MGWVRGERGVGEGIKGMADYCGFGLQRLYRVYQLLL